LRNQNPFKRYKKIIDNELNDLGSRFLKKKYDDDYYYYFDNYVQPVMNIIVLFLIYQFLKYIISRCPFGKSNKDKKE
jgi:hypothetical protein